VVATMMKVAGILVALLMLAGTVGCTTAKSSVQSNNQITSQSQTTTKSPTSTLPSRASGSTTGRPGATTPGTGASAVNMVKGDGVVAVVNYANLYFGTGGKIEKIYVKEGDHVAKGDVLANLDTTSLTVTLAQAKVALDTTQIAQQQANLSLQTAQMNLDKNKVMSDENDKISDIKMQIKAVQSMIPFFNADFCAQHITMFQQQLDNENKNLLALFGLTDDAAANAYISNTYTALNIQDVRTLALQVKSAQKVVDSAQETIDQAQSNFNLVQKQFDDASIKAPFDGMVATLNYNEGDIVATPSPTQPPVIYLVDPGSLAVNFNVSELDIPKVKIDQPASISILALPGIKLNGKITAISPVSAVQDRTVNYSIAVGLSVPPNVVVKAGMDASVQITIADTTTQPTTQSTKSVTQTLPVQITKSTLPASNNSDTPSTTSANGGVSSLMAIKGTGSITDLIYANLYFGTGGKIDKLYVKPGDITTKGMVLAELDTTNLQAALIQAQVALDQANLTKAQAVTALQAAQTTLDKTQLLIASKMDIFNMQWQIRVLQLENLDPSDGGSIYRMQQILALNAQTNSKIKAFLTYVAQPEFTGVVTYDLINAKFDTLMTEDINIKTLQVKTAQQNVDKAQDAIDQAQINLDVAQKQLDQAVIKAPFDGMAANVNYNTGDMLASPSPSQKPVIYLVDPIALAAVITVNELDVTNMHIGQTATVNIDAFPGINLTGKISGISAVPIVRGGIVDYNVTITLSIPPNIEIKPGMNASAQIKAN
jgi:HlyD family secretion protein